MTVFEAVAAQIRTEGVRAVFGLMGDGNLKLIPTLTATHGIPFHGARHEGGAVAMADGYARSTGEVGVCTFTQGPGLTNALTALVSAQRGRVPMVVVCGDTPRAVVGLPQDIEQAPFFAACGIAVQEVAPATAHRDVAAAFRRARVERRPIALNLPTDEQEEAALDEPCAPDRTPVPVRRTLPDLGPALRAIAAAERPVVIGGRGAVEAGAREELVALADHVGALLATSLPANGWFSGHPYAVGIAGGFASDLGLELIGDADCVVAFGAGLNHFTSRGGTLFPDATVVQVDLDDEAFGRFVPTAVGVVGDAGVVATALRDALPSSAGYRTPGIAERIAAHRDEAPDESGDDGLDPRALSRAVAGLLPADRTLVVDGGHFMGFPSMGIPVDEPSRFVFTLDFGSIGLGIGAAVGAAVGHPDRVTVAAVGDGGLMMSLGELDTAVRYRLPLLVVVYNDEAYGAELHFLRMSGLPEAESRLATPPLDAVARAMGADGLAVRSLADLDGLRERLADGLDGPLLLDCRVTERVRAAWLEEAFDRGTH
ncbi:thiamine pyrophosphate-binding protein [Patulibacter sp.]|uniref:thiamine pyrophosphate-binding protein n=1 Tax=Patulibacter sp. TaxID=1912859 RepID=UPI00271BEF26|nr:thiamine pyrophosphate-binding protein [Patulibacter sp.]MDO9407702.1 thiamine pyrophosphate-binding protein [Patulibacter sp.]